MIWIVLGVVVLGVAAGGGYWWWKRRQRSGRMISFVALLREPVTFDPAVLARVAGKVWKADLGDGASEGEDGFVVSGGIATMIQCKGRMALVNAFPTTYTPDVEETAEGIVDLRLRGLFLEHTAWFSCDALGVDDNAPDEEVQGWYRVLGKLFAELLDDNCLLIYLPETSAAFPINEDTEAALRSRDPIEALNETMNVPVIAVADDDPLMKEAVAKARAGWPKFVAAYEASAGENFAVKAPVSHSGNTEFIWIGVTSIEGERIYGTLGHDPANLGPLKLGSKVSVKRSDLNDWMYFDPQGQMTGGFTIEAVQKAAARVGKEKKKRRRETEE